MARSVALINAPIWDNSSVNNVESDPTIVPKESAINLPNIIPEKAISVQTGRRVCSTSTREERINPAGVAQGTQLCPWLFLAMINHLVLPEDTSTMWKFADDTKISEVVKKSNYSTLQTDISTLSRDNLFHLNPIKCKEIIISFTQPPLVYEPIRTEL